MLRNKEYIKQRVITHYYRLLEGREKYGVFSKICSILRNENIITNRSFVQWTVRTFQSCGKLYRDKRNGRRNTKSSNPNILRIIENCMRDNDETTAKEIRQFLLNAGYSLSISLINKLRKNIGLTLRGTHYCQLVRENNKTKRLHWAFEHMNDDFNDVIWTDETSIFMEQFKRRCYRKKSVPP